jgi:hypothetical protein
MGADVLKIEPPIGDEMRMLGPKYSDGRSIYFESLNAKRAGRCAGYSQSAVATVAAGTRPQSVAVNPDDQDLCGECIVRFPHTLIFIAIYFRS